MNDIQRYPVEVFWSDEDEGFIAVALDLPGCTAWGANEADALREIRDAIAAWIEAAIAAGNLIPVPSRPADQNQFSGRFVVRVPRRLHADLVRGAQREGTSLNQYVVYLLTETNLRTSIAHQMAPFMFFGTPVTVGMDPFAGIKVETNPTAITLKEKVWTQSGGYYKAQLDPIARGKSKAALALLTAPVANI